MLSISISLSGEISILPAIPNIRHSDISDFQILEYLISHNTKGKEVTQYFNCVLSSMYRFEKSLFLSHVCVILFYLHNLCFYTIMNHYI